MTDTPITPATPIRSATPTMPFEQLEQAYEQLALAIDRAGPANEALFLAKLTLTLAHRLGDVAVFRHSVEVALADLPASDPATSQATPGATASNPQ